MSEEEIARVVEEGRAGGAREVLMISGERPGAMAHIQEELGKRGYGDFWKFAAAVADRCGEAGLFPHGNFGRMTEEEQLVMMPVF